MKENNSKKEIQENIISTALSLFIEHGIKEVKMDDIATRLSISKRTIYEIFKDKEQLLFEALKLQHERMRLKGKEIIRTSSHVLEIILKLYSLYFKLIKEFPRNFFSEMEKYPEICKQQREKEKKNAKKFIAWMELGRQQGLFREDANFEIMMFILNRDLKTIFDVKMQTGRSELSNYTPSELGRSLILFYLRGISTHKGQEIIEDFLEKNETIIQQL